MYHFHNYLNFVVGINSDAYKSLLKDSRNDTQDVEYEFPVDWVDLIINKFNDGDFSEINKAKVCVLPSDLTIEEFESLLEEDLYHFSVDVMNNSPHGTKLHLFPSDSYSVNNKLFEAIYYIMVWGVLINLVSQLMVLTISPREGINYDIGEWGGNYF